MKNVCFHLPCLALTAMLQSMCPLLVTNTNIQTNIELNQFSIFILSSYKTKYQRYSAQTHSWISVTWLFPLMDTILRPFLTIQKRIMFCFEMFNCSSIFTSLETNGYYFFFYIIIIYLFICCFVRQCLSCTASPLLKFQFRYLKRKQAEDIWLIKQPPRSLWFKTLVAVQNFFLLLLLLLLFFYLKQWKSLFTNPIINLGIKNETAAFSVVLWFVRKKEGKNIKDKTWLQADNRKFSKKK